MEIEKVDETYFVSVLCKDRLGIFRNRVAVKSDALAIE
jgi:hypothetical protein